VLGYRASEVAVMLDATLESVTSALKRARATLAGDLELRGHPTPPPPPGSVAERRLVERFVEAFGAYDVDGIVALLTEDAWVKMPPMPFEYRGREAAARFFTAIAPPGYRDCRFVRTRANGQPACACYVRDPAVGVWRSVGVLVLTLAGDLISEITRFDTSVLASFGLPRTLAQPPDDPGLSGRS
jgi:RNA polymerase sigma-70 factor (ECF subfamily)